VACSRACWSSSIIPEDYRLRSASRAPAAPLSGQACGPAYLSLSLSSVSVASCLASVRARRSSGMRSNSHPFSTRRVAGSSRRHTTSDPFRRRLETARPLLRDFAKLPRCRLEKRLPFRSCVRKHRYFCSCFCYYGASAGNVKWEPPTPDAPPPQLPPRVSESAGGRAESVAKMQGVVSQMMDGLSPDPCGDDGLSGGGGGGGRGIPRGDQENLAAEGEVG